MTPGVAEEGESPAVAGRLPFQDGPLLPDNLWPVPASLCTHGRAERERRDHDGSIKIPQQLSRGTREQLYLDLRFGLVLEFGEHVERLPVVVDEALVDFDSERARLAAECFAQLSETNQVLVSTCYPTMVDFFANMPGAQDIDVDVAG